MSSIVIEQRCGPLCGKHSGDNTKRPVSYSLLVYTVNGFRYKLNTLYIFSSSDNDSNNLGTGTVEFRNTDSWDVFKECEQDG